MIGIHTKLSWLSPKTTPFFSATPTTLSGWPSTSISLPIGSIVPKKASTRSVPITATSGRLDVVLGRGGARPRGRGCVPMRAMFSVTPAMPHVLLDRAAALDAAAGPDLARPPRSSSVQALRTASQSSIVRRLRFCISSHCSWLVMMSGVLLEAEGSWCRAPAPCPTCSGRAPR